jgi:hypothetical protein
VVEMQSSQSSSLSTGHLWTKAQIGGHRSGEATTSWTSCLRLVMRRSGVRFPEAALRPFDLTSAPFGRILEGQLGLV